MTIAQKGGVPEISEAGQYPPRRSVYEGDGGWTDGRLGQAYDLIDAAMREAGQHPESSIGEAFKRALDWVETADNELECYS